LELGKEEEGNEEGNDSTDQDSYALTIVSGFAGLALGDVDFKRGVPCTVQRVILLPLEKIVQRDGVGL